MTATPDNGYPTEAELHKQAIERAMQNAANKAIALHQRLGLPMVEWRDGKAILVPPEELDLPNDSAVQ